jgi:hypothetical protein
MLLTENEVITASAFSPTMTCAATALVMSVTDMILHFLGLALQALIWTLDSSSLLTCHYHQYSIFTSSLTFNHYVMPLACIQFPGQISITPPFHK